MFTACGVGYPPKTSEVVTQTKAGLIQKKGVAAESKQGAWHQAPDFIPEAIGPGPLSVATTHPE